MALTEEQRAKLNAKAGQASYSGMNFSDYDEYQEFLRFKEMKRQQASCTTKFCKYCGATISESEQMCPVCGKVLNGVVVAPSVGKTASDSDEVWVYDRSDVPFILMAFVPLLGIVLSRFGVHSTTQIIVLIICNCILLSMDIKLLRQYPDFENAWWLYTGLFLMPVYMFIRVSNTTKQYWPAIVWCISFAISLII